MASVGRFVHPQADFEYGPVSQLAPGVKVTMQTPDGTLIEDPDCLRMLDPDGETHVYIFSDEGKRNLMSQLTGGVILPDHVSI